MKIEPGVIITGVAMAIFYLRLAQLRGQKKRKARIEALRRRKDPKGKSSPLADPQTSYEIGSWVLVAIGVLLMLAGVAAYTSNFFPSPYDDYWWVATSAGVLVFAFSFK